VGDIAPPLHIALWLQGDEVASLQQGNVYVIEHWATWCGPCIAAMPHLSALQKEHEAAGLVVVGITSEDIEERELRRFVQRQKDRATYRLAWDDAGRTDRAWLAAAQQRGIPFAFVVNREGRIAFMGHPLELDDVLPKVLDGTWDLQAAREKQQVRRELLRLRDAYAKLMDEGQYEEAAQTLTKGLEATPALGAQLAAVIYSVHAQQLDDVDAANAFAARATDELLKDDANALNALAWKIADVPDVAGRDLTIALRAAKRARELAPSDAAIADTLAYVYAAQREWRLAAQTQALAVSLASDDETKQRYEETRVRYERSAK
jgi:thiol-disulfide isomerase/thioredoxin